MLMWFPGGFEISPVILCRCPVPVPVPTPVPVPISVPTAEHASYWSYWNALVLFT